MRMKWNTNNVSEWFRQRGSELLSEYEYHSKVVFKCSKCGVTDEQHNFNNLRKRNIECLCRKCSHEHAEDARKVNIDQVKQWFKKHDAKLIKFTGNMDKIFYICNNCGEESEYRDFSHLRRRNNRCWCKGCIKKEAYDNRKLLEEEVRQWFLDHNSELMSEYVGIDTDFLYKCSNCGFVTKGHSFDNFRRRDSKCWCRECRILYMTGEGSPNWNINRTNKEREKDRHSESWYKGWVQDVLRRDGYTCQISGDKNNLITHHLWSWMDFPEKRRLLENGVTLTKEIHIEFHQKYGYGKNTLEQFMQFIEEYNGN